MKKPFSPDIIVVDNGSSDGSERACEAIQNAKLIRAGENLGFASACNLGAQNCDAQYILFLNPDARLLPDSLGNVISFMQDPINKQVGICGVQLIDRDGHLAKSCSHFPTALGYAAYLTGLDRLLPALDIRMSRWDHLTTQPVDQVIGAFFFVRTIVFETLNGFDEQFFVYLEEVDFAYRAKQHGWSSIYLSNAQAFHAGGGTSDQVKAKRLFYSMCSRVLYAQKHFGFFGTSLVWLLTIFFEPLTRAAFSATKKTTSSVSETLKGLGYFFAWLPKYVLTGKTR